MPYTRRHTWPDNNLEDYVIRCEGLDVDRVYRTRVPEGERWLWSIYINGHVPRIDDGVPIAGLAPTLDTAAAQFKASYERMRAKIGCQSRSGESYTSEIRLPHRRTCRQRMVERPWR
jgi:hypothetical protein